MAAVRAEEIVGLAQSLGESRFPSTECDEVDDRREQGREGQRDLQETPIASKEQLREHHGGNEERNGGMHEKELPSPGAKVRRRASPLDEVRCAKRPEKWAGLIVRVGHSEEPKRGVG